MRRVIVTVLIANLMGLGWGASVSVVEAQTGRISGTVFSGPSGTDNDNLTVRLRNDTGQIVATTETNAAGEFSFAGLNPGNLVIEVVDANGDVVIVGTAIPLTAGATITDVPLTLPDTSPSFFLTGGGLGLLAAVAAAVTAGVAVSEGAAGVGADPGFGGVALTASAFQ